MSAPMDAERAAELCDALADLVSKGPAKDAQAQHEADALLRSITQIPQATPHLRERATEVSRALSGWFDSEERFHALLRTHRTEIYSLIDRLHSALRDALRFARR